MTTTLNETPSSDRIHIGIFGKTNSGKSSFINALTGQNISIVSDLKGTTTDPIYKAMEINPLGACILIDTAGFADDSVLGEKRLEKTKLAIEKSDLAIIIISDVDMQEELDLYDEFMKKKTPTLVIINKTDILLNTNEIKEKIMQKTKEEPLQVSTITKKGMEKVREALARKIPENYGNHFITGDLVTEDDMVMLVMPQDIQAPKGRLILPQVQTIRELLDKKCFVMSVTTDKMVDALKHLKEAPKLIITDSQVFDYVYQNKPTQSMLTSFSVLFAAYKGDLPYYMEGAKKIDALTEKSHVLIAECCTHAPLTEDIGRVKIPTMLRKRFGKELKIDIVSGTDFPKELSEYDLIIQCGACMFNKKYVLARINRAKSQNVAMTNYGVTIAHITGILDKISTT